jgi:hypothetical protein
MSKMGQCRTPWTSGYQGGRATFTTQEYMLLFTGGKKLFTKLVIRLKNNYAFSDIAVNFCEIFACPTHKQHEIKNWWHYFLIDPCTHCKHKHRNLQSLLVSCNKDSLEVNAEETKCIFTFHQWDAGQNHSLDTNKQFGVAKFTHLERTLTKLHE